MTLEGNKIPALFWPPRAQITLSVRNVCLNGFFRATSVDLAFRLLQHFQIEGNADCCYDLPPAYHFITVRYTRYRPPLKNGMRASNLTWSVFLRMAHAWCEGNRPRLVVLVTKFDSSVRKLFIMIFTPAKPVSS